MVLLPNKRLSEGDKKLIDQRSDDVCFYLFGLNNDTNLISLIPNSDDYQKWNSLCYDCFASGSFCEHGRILCRSCRNLRRQNVEKIDVARLDKDKKRQREIDSDDKMLAKKTLNLSLETDSSELTEDEKNKSTW